MTRVPTLAAVGAVCATRIYKVGEIGAPPAKVLASQAVEVTDGMAASAACAFVRLGGRAALYARTGEDARGRAMAAELAAAGLDVSGLRPVPEATSSHACVVVDGRGDRLVVPFHDPACDPSPAWLPLARIVTADIVLCDVRWPEGAEAALAAGRAAGIRTMIDADVAPLPVLRRLVPLAHHAVFSDQALRVYTGEPDIERALRAVAAEHPGEVGASCGAEGYAWLEGDRLRRVLAPRVEVVDTLAAGDILHGALALALAEGLPMAQAVAFAVTAASLKCARFGGRLGCPTRAEVEQAMA